MKKLHLIVVLLIAVVFMTACGSSSSSSSANKQERTAEDLFNLYIKAFTTADLASAKSIFPEYYSKSLTQETLDKSLERAKKEYGDDFNITVDITGKTKSTEEELKRINDGIASYFETDLKASECYMLEGTITFKGSKFEDTDPISGTAYCKYPDGWYLIEG